jgi:solute:Na+ symporter, SSS family
MIISSTHPIEFIVIGVYLTLMLGVGWAFKNFNSNVSDYFRNGCRGTWWLVGMSAFMASFSAWTFTGAAGVAFRSGWSVAIIFFANALGFLLNGLFFAPWFRQARVTTPPEMIRKRYGGRTQQFYAWINVPMGVVMSGIHLYGLAIFSSAIFGFPIEVVILALGFVVLFYSTSGGSWAVIATDFLQGLVLFPVTMVVAWLCLQQFGGAGGFLAEIDRQGLNETFSVINKPGEFAVAAFTWGWASAIIFKNVIAYNTMQSAARYFGVKDGRDARKAAFLAMGLTLAGSFFWFIPPMTGRLLFAEQINSVNIAKAAEAAYAVTALNVLPNGLIGLVVVAMFTATMSCMDTGLNRNTAIIIKDIYPALRQRFGMIPMSEDGGLLKKSRIVSAVLGIVIICMAYMFSRQEGVGIFELMLNFGSYLAIPMAMPLILGLFARRVPSWAAMTGVCCGFAASVSIALLLPIWGIKMTFQQTVFATSGFSTLGFLLPALAWRTASADYRQQVAAFFEEMLRPVDFEKEVGGANDLRQLKYIGGFAALIGLLILFLLPFGRTADEVKAILVISGILVVIGVAMFGSGKFSAKDVEMGISNKQKGIDS